MSEKELRIKGLKKKLDDLQKRTTFLETQNEIFPVNYVEPDSDFEILSEADSFEEQCSLSFMETTSKGEGDAAQKEVETSAVQGERSLQEQLKIRDLEVDDLDLVKQEPISSSVKAHSLSFASSQIFKPKAKMESEKTETGELVSLCAEMAFPNTFLFV